MSTAGFSAEPASTPQPVNLCPVCHQSYRLNEQFCPHCRIRLLLTGQTGKIGQPDLVEKVSHSVRIQALQHVDTIQIVCEIQGKSLVLPTIQTIVMGRMTNRGNLPDIDLSDFDALCHGVSRQHLRLTRDGLIYIEDLNTTNGTCINGQRLVPQAQYMLTNGDELKLGQLRIKIKFCKA
jgi:hypothetical protein